MHTWAKLPAMLFKLAVRGRFASVLALIDWSAPPVAMAVLYWFVLTMAVGLLVVLKVAAVSMLVLPGAAIFLLMLYVVVGALQVAGVGGTVRLFLAVPRFFFWKLGLYVRMATGKGARTWQKTERGRQAALAVG